MNATNRKIDPKADPSNDPAMKAFKGNRLASLMADIRENNPLAKPDRPHPPVESLKQIDQVPAVDVKSDADAPAPQTEAVADTATLPPVVELPSAGERLSDQVRSEVRHELLVPQGQEETITPQPMEMRQQEVLLQDGAVHTQAEQQAKRLRGRPRVSDERKRESSYTLSPHVADRIRDLAALEQYRLKRTISQSAIVEAMIEIAEKHIVDNKVLPS